MPSTESDRDPKPSGPKCTEENPFIKFKRFADAQIGAVLQGVIGLPSVFSKQPNNANARWAGMQDDLQRRDKLLTEQRAARESESNESVVDEGDEEREIPVKKFPGWKNTGHISEAEDAESLVKEYSSWLLPAFMRSGTGKSLDIDDRTGQVDTMDFFSPISKALFGHVRRSPLEDAVDWTERRQASVPSDAYRDCHGCHNVIHSNMALSGEQKTGTALNMIQSMVFKNINRTSIHCGQCLGPQSVLPYILFSPYSPLALSFIPPPKGRDDKFPLSEGGFSWCEAFEDLLLASQGRPMGLYQYLPLPFRPSTMPIAMDKSPHSEFINARSGMLWIRGLHYHGLLTREPPKSRLLELPSFESPILTKSPKLDVKLILEAFTETEQDTYDKLEDNEYGDAEEDLDDTSLEKRATLNWIVGHSFSEPEKIAQLSNAMFEELEKRFEDERSLSTEQNIMQVLKATFQEVDKLLGYEKESGDEEAWERILGQTSISPNRHISSELDPDESTSTQTESRTGQVAETKSSKTVGNEQVEEAQLKARIRSALDRVISTTTTTEQTTDENGGVHSTVRIEKVYADGRRSITETSNTQVSPTDTRRRTQQVSDEENLETTVPEMKREGEKTENKTDKRSLGWFWN